MGKHAVVELGGGWKAAITDGRVFTWFEADLFLAEDDPDGHRQPHRIPAHAGGRVVPPSAA